MTRHFSTEEAAHRKALAREVGFNLVALRQCSKIKLTQEMFCVRLGITKTMYAKWEAGIALPDPGVVYEICAKFGVTFSFVYEGNYSDLNLNLAASIARRRAEIEQGIGRRARRTKDTTPSGRKSRLRLVAGNDAA